MATTETRTDGDGGRRDQPRRGAGVRRRTRSRDGGSEVRRSAGDLAAHDAADRSHRSRRLRVRPGLRRLVDPGLSGDPRVRHAPDAGPVDRVRRPVLHAGDAVADLLGRRSGVGRALRARSPVRGPQGRAAPRRHRDRRRGLLRSRGRVLRVRPHLLRAGRESGVLRGGLERGLLEHRRPSEREAQLGLQAASEGGVLPGAAGRLDGESAQRDGGDDGGARDPVRVPSPRGVLGRPGRDRHALPAAAAHGRPDDDLQVRGQEHGVRRRQDRDLHAQADLPGERIGHARAPVAVEGRRSADVREGRVRPPERPGQALHRRAADARAGVAGVLRADDELISAASCRATRRR